MTLPIASGRLRISRYRNWRAARAWVRVLEAVKLDEARDPSGVGLLGSRAEVPESEISPHPMQESLLRLRRRQLRLVQVEVPYRHPSSLSTSAQKTSTEKTPPVRISAGSSGLSVRQAPCAVGASAPCVIDLTEVFAPLKRPTCAPPRVPEAAETVETAANKVVRALSEGYIGVGER